MKPPLPHRPPARDAESDWLVISKWEEHLRWLLQHTSRWPRSTRFTLTQRVQNHALDVLEMLIVARYEPTRREHNLREINLTLERSRFLLRAASHSGIMSSKGFETGMRGLDETGRLVHSWRQKATASRSSAP